MMAWLLMYAYIWNYPHPHKHTHIYHDLVSSTLHWKRLSQRNAITRNIYKAIYMCKFCLIAKRCACTEVHPCRWYTHATDAIKVKGFLVRIILFHRWSKWDLKSDRMFKQWLHLSCLHCYATVKKCVLIGLLGYFCQEQSSVSFSKVSSYRVQSHAASNSTHWGWVTHICVSKFFSLGSDNGLSPGRRQAIIWTNAIINWTLRNKHQWNFNQNSYIFIQENAFEMVVWKMPAILSRPQCVKRHTNHHHRTSVAHPSPLPIAFPIYIYIM